MRRFSEIEASWNRDIDITDKVAAELGQKGEEAVINFFRSISPRIEIRKSSSKEDAGRDATFSPKTIDSVVYIDGEPGLAPQISVSKNPKVRKEKFEQLKNRPFLRLDEMRNTDTAIPAGVILLEQEDIEKGRPVDKQILQDTLNSLRFDLTQTKNPKEIDKVKKTIALFENIQSNFDQKKRASPSITN